MCPSRIHRHCFLALSRCRPSFQKSKDTFASCRSTQANAGQRCCFPTIRSRALVFQRAFKISSSFRRRLYRLLIMLCEIVLNARNFLTALSSDQVSSHSRIDMSYAYQQKLLVSSVSPSRLCRIPKNLSVLPVLPSYKPMRQSARPPVSITAVMHPQMLAGLKLLHAGGAYSCLKLALIM
jgi:hypothetical protein